MSHGESPEQKSTRKVRERLTPLLGFEGARDAAAALGGTPATIDYNGERLALSIALALVRQCDAAREADRKERTPAIIFLDAADLARANGDHDLAHACSNAAAAEALKASQ